MPTLAELASAKPPLAAALAAGVDTLDAQQSIPFQLYNRMVLPLDGYVFWVKDSSAPVMFEGSLHWASEIEQEDDATVSKNDVVFTSLQDIQDFIDVAPNSVYIATWEGIQFAFSMRGRLYDQAQLWHYSGVALYSTFTSQVVNSSGDLDPSQAIVSNSLPIWLGLSTYVPFSGLPLSFPLYPAELVPNNAALPFGSINIQRTRPLSASPILGPTLTHDQLAADSVRITLYGLNNTQALSFLDLVNNYSIVTDAIGMMEMSIVDDSERRNQAELQIIAQRKCIEYEVAYWQHSSVNSARQLIEHARVILDAVIPGKAQKITYTESATANFLITNLVVSQDIHFMRSNNVPTNWSITSGDSTHFAVDQYGQVTLTSKVGLTAGVVTVGLTPTNSQGSGPSGNLVITLS